ncbi:uncharacterized protein MELLADRAFT_62022 [Melampsora larici-populina 98AG31]|uniref:Secreted protein n=1 Tax=Melampsora larici-populina (strain 98AG31 / pathotype 3-4-7) TaxID=747676 RepID=F4RGW0_MELLP|nr:uncharacterized protein MELLADRAFT_62022 [Melampsora larici-populina 98AG31]EGG08210.1 hypothetical protein MELLADRAFT_62022 [Melampsora larici-populina 98AG31]
MTNLKSFVIVVLCILSHMGLSMKHSLQKPRFNIREGTLDTELSPHTCIKDLPTQESSIKRQKNIENQDKQKLDLSFARQSLQKELPKRPPRSDDGKTMLGKYSSFSPIIERHVPGGSIKSKAQFSKAELGKTRPSSKGSLVEKVTGSPGSTPCIQKMTNGNSVPKRSLVDQIRIQEDSRIFSNKCQKIIENNKEGKEYLVLGGMSRQSPQDYEISELSTSKCSTSHRQIMRNEQCVPDHSPSVQARITYNQVTAPNKYQKFVENSEQHRRNLSWDSQSFNKYLNKHSNQLGQEEQTNRRYKSIGQKMETPVPFGTMKNQGKLRKTEYALAETSSQGHHKLELSRYKGPSSHEQKMSVDQHEPKQRPLKRARTDQNPQIGAKQYNQDFPPDCLQVSSKHLKNQVSHDKELGDGYVSKSKDKSTKFQKIEHSSAQRIPGIDIQRFHLHNPDKMCSAAAAHFTQDLIETLKIRYQAQSKLSLSPTWEVGKEMWTSDSLLPFVYFVVSCNPDLKIWVRIKEVTMNTLKVYHKQCVITKSCFDQEKLAQFLLWHTNVIYQIAQLGPKIKSSPEDKRKISLHLTSSGLSTLARIVYLIYADKTFASFMRNSHTRLVMLKRHVSQTFEDDYQKGYPEISTKNKVHGSVWKNWIIKSLEIRNKAENIQWPKVPKSQISDTEPILFLKADLNNDIRMKMNNEVSEFISQWEMDFKNTMKIIKTSQSGNSGFPSVSIKDFCRGIQMFLKQAHNTRTSKLQVTLFSEFLHQDSQESFYVEFWNHFRVMENKKLEDALYQRNKRMGIGR